MQRGKNFECELELSFGLSLQLQDLKTSLQDLQTDFQIQLKALRKELETEREARIKLEAEVRLHCV